MQLAITIIIIISIMLQYLQRSGQSNIESTCMHATNAAHLHAIQGPALPKGEADGVIQLYMMGIHSYKPVPLHNIIQVRRLLNKININVQPRCMGHMNNALYCISIVHNIILVYTILLNL